ncbi:HCP oxidoreductase, NADH-dependent [Salmonella enterica subsp. enterica serovar Enteritidis str. 6.0562-1]|nr:HCP oxidoreductase, NADH-dependent [Salmonella enterica subsp. enterica serovar Enteritidis str. 6.0562-1]
MSSTMTLSEAEIAEGYVLACSCHPQSDLVLA